MEYELWKSIVLLIDPLRDDVEEQKSVEMARYEFVPLDIINRGPCLQMVAVDSFLSTR